MYQQYIGGKLVTGLGKPLDVLDPSTGEVVGTVGSANAAQAQQALDAAAEYRFIRTVSVYGTVVLPLLESDLLHIMQACTNGTLAEQEVKFSDGAAACVILASGGYPVAYEKGKPISGLVDGQLPDEENVTVYHSGTAITEDGQLVTNGGRVLGVTATGPRLTNALSHAYEAAEKISFEKLHKRSDIGLRALKALAEKQ